MDLIINADGVSQWSLGPTTAPVLSNAARRLTGESSPTVGTSSCHDQDDLLRQDGSGSASASVASDWSIDPADWAASQFAAAQLGDCRRTTRLVRLAAQVARDPASSLPGQADTWGDLKAAYRLLDRPEVTFSAVATPHWQLTRAQPDRDRLLIIDDTTEIDYGSQRQAAGLGPVGRGTGRGYLLHSALAIDPSDEWVVGLAGQVLFHRKPAPKGETLTQKQRRDRESAVWGQLIEQVGPPPPKAQWIHVMDRRADDFEVFCRARRVGADWIGRVKSRNRIVRDAAEAEMPLSDVLAAAVGAVAGGYTLALRARPGQPARQARVEVTFAPVTTSVPRQPPASLKALKPGPIAQGWSGPARSTRRQT